jgi:hypothetical protein
MGIKTILIGITLLLFVLVIRRHSRLLERTCAVLLFSGIVFAIVFPDITTRAANVLGVGRGTDLVFYVSFFLFFLVINMAFERIGQLQRRVTILTRTLALMSVVTPSDSELPRDTAKGLNG